MISLLEKTSHFKYNFGPLNLRHFEPACWPKAIWVPFEGKNNMKHKSHFSEPVRFSTYRHGRTSYLLCLLVFYLFACSFVPSLFLVEFCSLPLYRSSSYPPFSFFFLSDHSFAIFFLMLINTAVRSINVILYNIHYNSMGIHFL